ncbi:ATP-binding protein [Enterobacter roggenkampii]|uniref:ATP-binding protein n=1 Tax=Enterobacter roggenkampii TaxID=1812935 RepID=UPI0009C304E9|nr:ATP-binding protein [Enterobacter roggenkampii]AQT88734.1 DNA replication protein DnaC [Enterobacter roggenkampii]ASG37998.1 DNA replication protein DnaC [Enterobacter roggenkampii]EMF0891704.1 ATP-binding protein [Enterobacter roggenkampii]MCK7252812.1 ATP-binding protein [Enterobacter roggenkampii]MDK4549059.1 ATP-binding protein [Enterobacter roggenkampii]
MRDMADVLKRLQKIVPAGVQPKFSSAEELMAWQQEEARKHSEKLNQENSRTRLEKTFGRSGIRERYQNCTFKNYSVENDGQRKALSYAKSWLNNFGSGCACFVFSGSPGTGKNHLAAAIGNALLAQHKSVLIITVADLMTEFKAGFSGGKTEAQLMEQMSRVDLLVLDEVGVQMYSQYEKVILHQIIDRRTAMLKPVGVLTNLKEAELTQAIGERALDRLRMGGGLWVNFDWRSHRATTLN